MNTQQIMSELDENKENIPENLYLQLANLLKDKYNEESNRDDDEDDDEDENEDILMRIVYIPEFKNVILKYVKALPYDNYTILIRGYIYDEYDVYITRVEQIIMQNILNVLPLEALKDVVETLGGYAQVEEHIKLYQKDDYETALKHIESLSEIDKYREYTEYITHFMVYEYEYIYEYPQHNVVRLESFLQILEGGNINLIKK